MPRGNEAPRCVDRIGLHYDDLKGAFSDWRLLENLLTGKFSGTKNVICWRGVEGNVYSFFFFCEHGVRQGCVRLPLLFSISFLSRLNG